MFVVDTHDQPHHPTFAESIRQFEGQKAMFFGPHVEGIRMIISVHDDHLIYLNEEGNKVFAQLSAIQYIIESPSSN